jgi:hypothetical protein
MSDNVILASGAVTFATKGDPANVQHQQVAAEILSSAGVPLPLSTSVPLPVVSEPIQELLTAILVELRVQSEMQYALANTECEPIEMLREKFKGYPVTP